MKSYIDLNTSNRKLAKNEFEKDFYKLMNNSAYGKTMENVRNRINFKLINSAKKLLNINYKPTYKSCTILSENLVGVHQYKGTSTLDKPIYISVNVYQMIVNY